MSNDSPIQGPIPVLPTAFSADGGVDTGGLKSVLAFCKDHGIRSVCLPAFGSEFYKLTAKERSLLLEEAVRVAGSDIAVIAQCNHYHAETAVELVRDAESIGCSAVSVALPRNFPVAEAELVDYAIKVIGGTQLPAIVQDWNPGGASLSPAAVAAIREKRSNFIRLKLEEPAIGNKVAAIREATGGQVEILGGWGGYYLLEHFQAGIVGLMPGVSMIDVFQRVWKLLSRGAHGEAYRLFTLLLPLIELSLRNFERFHHVEKAIALRRGLLANAIVRSPTNPPDAQFTNYINMLLDHLAESLIREGFKWQNT